MSESSQGDRAEFVRAYVVEYPERGEIGANAAFNGDAGRMWLAARRHFSRRAHATHEPLEEIHASKDKQSTVPLALMIECVKSVSSGRVTTHPHTELAYCAECSAGMDAGQAHFADCLVTRAQQLLATLGDYARTAHADELIRALEVASSARGAGTQSGGDSTKLEADAHNVEPTTAMIDAYLAFTRKTSHLSHPDVPYRGTVNGDTQEDWLRRLAAGALRTAIAAGRKRVPT